MDAPVVAAGGEISKDCTTDSADERKSTNGSRPRAVQVKTPSSFISPESWQEKRRISINRVIRTMAQVFFWPHQSHFFLSICIDSLSQLYGLFLI